MNARTILISFALGFSGAALAPACIVPCNAIACGPAFEWTGQASGGAALTPGTYRIAVTLEDDSYEIECTIAATYGESSCDEPVHVSGETEYSLDLRLNQADPDNWDPNDPVSGLYLIASDTSGSSAEGNYSETRGPTQVSVAITVDDAPLTDVDYALEYDRDEDFYGDPACGWCDEVQARTHEW